MEVSSLNLHDFGIFLELEPDEEEQQQLEQNIQVALSKGGIDLEDAIDLRQIKNLKLANQMLKIKRKSKGKQEQENALEQSRAQADAQAGAAEKIAMSEVQKQEAISGSKVQYEQARSQMEIQRMQTAAQLEQQKMQAQFEFDMQLKQMDMKATQQKESEIENRKDTRIKMEGSQQSQMIDQRKNDLSPIDFEQQDTAQIMPSI